MAQKKLLFPLILLCLLSTGALASEGLVSRGKDQEFANSISKKVKDIALKEIKDKWIDLQKLLGMKPDSDAENNEGLDLESGVDFKIFVSSSMSRNLLKSYARAARKYQGVMVLNGLPEGSFKALAEFVNAISEDDEWSLNIQIDNEAFNKFKVHQVPSFVLSKEEDVFAENSKITFDKASGAISARRALEIFASEGDLTDIATKLLKSGKR